MDAGRQAEAASKVEEVPRGGANPPPRWTINEAGEDDIWSWFLSDFLTQRCGDQGGNVLRLSLIISPLEVDPDIELRVNEAPQFKKTAPEALVILKQLDGRASPFIERQEKAEAKLAVFGNKLSQQRAPASDEQKELLKILEKEVEDASQALDDHAARLLESITGMVVDAMEMPDGQLPQTPMEFIEDRLDLCQRLLVANTIYNAGWQFFITYRSEIGSTENLDREHKVAGGAARAKTRSKAEAHRELLMAIFELTPETESETLPQLWGRLGFEARILAGFHSLRCQLGWRIVGVCIDRLSNDAAYDRQERTQIKIRSVLDRDQAASWHQWWQISARWLCGECRLQFPRISTELDKMRLIWNLADLDTHGSAAAAALWSILPPEHTEALLSLMAGGKARAEIAVKELLADLLDSQIKVALIAARTWGTAPPLKPKTRSPQQKGGVASLNGSSDLTGMEHVSKSALVLKAAMRSIFRDAVLDSAPWLRPRVSEVFLASLRTDLLRQVT